jgi:hypothetical protein
MSASVSTPDLVYSQTRAMVVVKDDRKAGLVRLAANCQSKAPRISEPA